VVSPILSNIYLNRLDRFVSDTLIPENTHGKERRLDPEYNRIKTRGQYYRRTGRPEKAEKLRREAKTHPSKDPSDPTYRRLRYVRYADDFLLGLVGTKAEAEAIREKLATFLQRDLNLILSPEKTLVTHALTERARFLGYEVGIMRNPSRRVVNGKIGLYIPDSVIESKRQHLMRNGKVIQRADC